MLLPEDESTTDHLYEAFFGLFGATLVMRFIANFIRIYQQSKCDIFIIDQENAAGGPQNSTEVNAWRSIFVANEWSELQCENRIIEPETSFIWFVFFWIGLGWKEFCASDPELTNIADPNIR